VQRLDEIIHIGDPVLEQVAAAASGTDQLHGLLDLDVRGQHQDGDVGEPLADFPGCLEPLSRVPGRHADVHDGEIGQLLADDGQQALRVAGLADDGEARAFQEARQRFPEQHVIVGHCYTNSHSLIMFRGQRARSTGYRLRNGPGGQGAGDRRVQPDRVLADVQLRPRVRVAQRDLGVPQSAVERGSS
jgi:hypothetical protein